MDRRAKEVGGARGSVRSGSQKCSDDGRHRRLKGEQKLSHKFARWYAQVRKTVELWSLRAPLRREAPMALRGRWNIGIDKAMVRVSFQAGLRRYLAEVMLG